MDKSWVTVNVVPECEPRVGVDYYMKILNTEVRITLDDHPNATPVNLVRSDTPNFLKSRLSDRNGKFKVIDVLSVTEDLHLVVISTLGYINQDFLPTSFGQTLETVAHINNRHVEAPPTKGTSYGQELEHQGVAWTWQCQEGSFIPVYLHMSYQPQDGYQISITSGEIVSCYYDCMWVPK